MKTLLPIMLVAALVAAPEPAAADPLSSPSVDDLVQRLSAPESLFKSFRPTRAPGRDHQCEGNPGAADTTAPGYKNLAVEYADASDAQVDLEVQFEINRDRLLPAGREVLQTLAEALNRPELKQSRFAIAGHTDASGARDTNLRLSCARAIAVRQFLVEAGVAPERLWAHGFGPNRLLALPDVNDARHRRVEVRRAPR